MSVKAMGLVWDLECQKKHGDLEFRSSHKFVLLAYADHADHHGKNIWPAVSTVANKTGLDDRTVQRLTRELETIGFLVDDGQGPRGTRRWKLPINEKGWQHATPDILTGGNGDKSLGDIPLGDIPLGDTTPPDFKEPEPNQIINTNNISDVWGDIKTKLQDLIKRVDFETWVKPTDAVSLEDKTLTVGALNDRAKAWLTKNLTSEAQDLLGLYVKFVTFAEINTEYVTEFEDVRK